MIFFDINEYQNLEEKRFKLPSLGGQWKVIFDFKPTEYVREERERIVMSLVLYHNNPRFKYLRVRLAIGSSKICLHSCDIVKDDVSRYVQSTPKFTIESNELPEVGKWTRVEISHEKEDDKYFLYLAVGGKELGRKEVTSGELRGPAGTVVNGNIKNFQIPIQPGLFRRLIALGK